MPGQNAVPRRFTLHKTVALIGMMGSGKTAIGKALSARLKVPFFDSDMAIEQAAQASISEIFSRDGEVFFRNREAEVIARLLAGPAGILSTGGGAYLAQRNREAIAQYGLAVWLDVPLATLWERVRNKDTRPLLRTADPKKTLADLLAQRTPFYNQAQVIVPSISGYSIEKTTTNVIAGLLTYPDVLEGQI
ncbi:MAG: shikimate kinase [Rhodobacteraceae bacterium]|nr:shikimate kinase [Paracoccaceae bacterium]